MKRSIENSLWGFAFFLIALAWLFGLFVDLTGDSGLYAAISRQMAESGDWFNLKINGEAYDQKPHLFFWLAGLGIRIFGNSNFAFKLFPFVYGLGGIYFTYRLGKQLFSNETGKLAALIVATSQIYFLYFFDFHTDSVLQTGVVLALWQLAAYLQAQKPANFIFGFVGIGLAMLSKGPIGGVLPFFGVLFFLLARKDYRQLFHPKWLLGILVSLAVVSPSLVHLYQSFGVEGLKFFFITNNFGRISGDYAGSSTDYFFYLHTLLWAFLPWTAFVVAGLFLEIKSWFDTKTQNAWGWYLLGSVLAFTLILSIAKGKAPNYFLIAVSPISVVAARWINRINAHSSKTKAILLFIQKILVLLFAVFFLFAALVLSPDKIWLAILILISGIAVVLYVFRNQSNELRRLIFLSVIAVAAINLYFNAIIIPSLYEYQGARQVLKIYEDHSSPETQLYNLDMEEYELFFYAEDPVLQIKDWDKLHEVMNQSGTWLYTNEIKYKDILTLGFSIDTVYQIPQRGMNRISIKFLNPATREESLATNYLIKSK